MDNNCGFLASYTCYTGLIQLGNMSHTEGEISKNNNNERVVRSKAQKKVSGHGLTNERYSIIHPLLFLSVLSLNLFCGLWNNSMAEQLLWM